MRNQNTLRQFGGAAIKSRDKFIRLIIIVNVIVFLILVCYGLYYLFDTVWNGYFVDWFMKNYTEKHTQYVDGEQAVVISLAWYKIKREILRGLIGTVVAVAVVVMIASHLYAKRQVENSIKVTSEQINRYVTEERDAMEVFPTEYAEIAAQIVQMKSAMQRHEQILKEETRRKNDLITYLAHDLKTPLTSVLGYLRLLDEAPNMPEKQKKAYIKIALNKADRLELLINEFFDITRYNLQTVILEKETIDLYYMLIQMTDEFYPILQAHGNQAVLKTNEDITVYGDSMKLARVFNNILKNAIAYSFPNTTITISAEEKAEELIISFQNHGKTIPKQKLNDIFEKFFRLDESRAVNTGGAGLGLAIAKEIVTLHGGKIYAESENEVTAFYVSLPKKAAE